MADSLHVAHVVLSLDVGGLERVVVDLVRERRTRGRDVSVVCLERPGSLAPEAAAAGARVCCAHKRAGLRWESVADLRAILRELKPDVLHTHHIGALFYAGLAIRRSRRRIVHTEHGRLPSQRLRTRLLANLAGRSVARFCCVSREIAADAANDFHVPQRRIRLVPNGIAVERFRSGNAGRDGRSTRAAVRHALAIPPDALVIGTVGRLVEVKRQDLLLHAAARLGCYGIQTHLLLVGDGPQRGELQRLAADLGLGARTHLVGVQSQPERYLAAMDCFALPSRSEGMPLAVLEAWSMGLPVVASRVGGLPDLIDSGRTGLLVQSGDAVAWADALRSLLADPDQRRRMGAAGRSTVYERYTVARMSETYERLYDEVRPRRVARPESSKGVLLDDRGVQPRPSQSLRACHTGAGRSSEFVPSEWSRLRLRIAYEWRRRVWAVCKRWHERIQIPVVGGAVRWLLAWIEVRWRLRNGIPASSAVADALQPTAVPSIAGGDWSNRVLAEIDQDGFAFALNPRDRPVFDRRADKLLRRRYRLDVVLHDGTIRLRKQFLAQRTGWRPWFWNVLGLPFYTELAALLRLRDLSGVPRLRGLDFRRRTIDLDFIHGESLRHQLARSTGPIHDRDLAACPDLSRLGANESKHREMCRSAGAWPPEQRRRLRHLVLALNHRGVAPLDVKPGNVLTGARSDELYWIDFERAHLRGRPGWSRQLVRQYQLLNDWFGLDFLTGLTGLETCPTLVAEAPVYAPVDLGPLGMVGNISDVEVGEGRWRWLLRRQSDWTGKRILDLGSNNCLYAVRALQAGAAEAHCVERDAAAIRQSELVRAAAEQAACRPLNLRVHHSDIQPFLAGAQFPDGYFDFAWALCSLYYLSRDEIRACLRIIARLSRECWLQANIGTPRDCPELREKASVEFLTAQLRGAGFDDITTIAPAGYRRPLLIGRRNPRDK